MRKTLFLILLLFSFGNLFGQSPIRKNALIFDIGGPGFIYSLNYERQGETGLLGRIGVTYLGKNYYFPVSIGKIFFKANHHLELNASFTYLNYDAGDLYDDSRKNGYFASSFIGYRYQKPTARFLFRAGLTPVFPIHLDDSDDPGGEVIWGAISFGYRF